MKTDQLNVHELWTLQNLANGVSNREQALTAGLSINTILERRKYINKKLGVHTVEHAVAEALRRGLIK